MGAGGFARMGYTVARQLVDAENVEEYRAHLAAVQSAAPRGPSSIRAFAPDRDAFLASVAADPRLVGWAEELLASPVTCFGMTYMVKEAMVGPEALWHQDGYPWQQQMGITDAVTLWIALDDVNEANGALRVIRGSHVRPAQPLVPAATPEDGGYFGAGIDPGPFDPADVDVLVLATGDVSAHHPCLIHGSGPNTSSEDRRALVLRYRPSAGGGRDA